MMEDDSQASFDALPGIGGAIVVCILISILLVAINDWDWYTKFLGAGGASGWAQAVGAVGAIAFGFGQIDRQNRYQRQRDERRAKEVACRQVQAIAAACLQADEALAWAGLASQIEQLAHIEPLELATEEALTAFKNIPFSEVPDTSLLVLCGAIRKDLVTLLIQCRAAKEAVRPTSDFLQGFVPQFERDLKAAKRRAAALLTDLAKLPPRPRGGNAGNPGI